MATHGGPGRGGGRKPGSINRLATDAIAKARAEGILPHEWLLKIARGEPIEQKVWDIQRDPNGNEIGRKLKVDQVYPNLDMRVDAAKSAAPYYAPKLAQQQVSLTGEDGGPVEINVSELSDDKKAKLVNELLSRVGERVAESEQESE